MIEGLHYDVHGSEIVALMKTRIDQLQVSATRLRELAKAAEGIVSDNPGGSNSSKPQQEALDKAKAAEREIKELGFMAAHIVQQETYRLEASDLLTLGVTTRGW